MRRLSELLGSLILERDAKAKVNPESKRWLDAMRLLINDRDGDVAEVERVLRWSQADGFWQSNILSPGKLREKFSQLLQQMRRTPGSRNGHDPERDARRARGRAALEALQREAAGRVEVRDHPYTDELAAEWEPIAAQLRERVGDDQFDLWLAVVHPHQLNGRVVLGAPAAIANSLTFRFGSLLEACLGRPVDDVVVCDCVAEPSQPALLAAPSQPLLLAAFNGAGPA